MKKAVIILFIYLLSVNSFGQSPSIQWQKSFGGGMYEYAKEIEATIDGGYITAGYSESSDGNVSFNHGAGDCWIVKTNASGSIQWENSYGGTGFDYGCSIQQTSDGGYIVVGYSESNDGDITANKGAGDCWVIKLDNSGTIQWQKTYGGALNDNGQSIRQTIDGGYIVAGNTESSGGDVTVNYGGSDCWILKLDSSGLLEWEKTLGGSSYDYAQDIRQTADGGFILSGGTHSNNGDVAEQNGNGDCWIVKMSDTGNIIWENSFGGSDYDFAQSIEETYDGGYIAVGYSESVNGDITDAHGNGDCWVIKCNSSGNIEWQKALGSSGNDYGYSIIQATGGEYVLIGYSELNDGDVTGNHGNYDCWVVQLNETGNVYVQKSFGGTGVDIGYSIRQTSAVSYIIAGYSDSNDGDITGNHGSGDSWVIKLNLLSVGVEENLQPLTINVSPNPSNGNFNFSGLMEGSIIDIYDVTGKIVSHETTETINYSVDITNQAKGIYFYNVISKSGEYLKGKIIIQ